VFIASKDQNLKIFVPFMDEILTRIQNESGKSCFRPSGYSFSWFHFVIVQIKNFFSNSKLLFNSSDANKSPKLPPLL